MVVLHPRGTEFRIEIKMQWSWQLLEPRQREETGIQNELDSQRVHSNPTLQEHQKDLKYTIGSVPRDMIVQQNVRIQEDTEVLIEVIVLTIETREEVIVLQARPEVQDQVQDQKQVAEDQMAGHKLDLQDLHQVAAIEVRPEVQAADHLQNHHHQEEDLQGEVEDRFK